MKLSTSGLDGEVGEGAKECALWSILPDTDEAPSGQIVGILIGFSGVRPVFA